MAREHVMAGRQVLREKRETYRCCSASIPSTFNQRVQNLPGLPERPFRAMRPPSAVVRGRTPGSQVAAGRIGLDHFRPEALSAVGSY